MLYMVQITFQIIKHKYLHSTTLNVKTEL